MTKIEYSKTQITATGHANYDVCSKDIVCAGISAIMMGAINWFKPTDLKYEINQKIPAINLQLITINDQNLLLINLILKQLTALIHEYPKYVKISKLGE